MYLENNHCISIGYFDKAFCDYVINISENPLMELKEKIIRGDKGDGIPNILSPSDCFVREVRQTTISKIKLEKLMEKNYAALNDQGIRFVINEGGSRSSKTYSLCQLVIIYCLQNNHKVVSIIRKTFPALRATVLRDFIEILKELNIYSVEDHNKSEHIYTFPNGSIVEFFSVDDEQKIRGRKRDIAWCNEANELYFDDC